jgi:hypothetical protein
MEKIPVNLLSDSGQQIAMKKKPIYLSNDRTYTSNFLKLKNLSF